MRMGIQKKIVDDQFDAEALEIICEHVPAGLWRLDKEGNLVYANNAFLEIFGRDFQDIKDQEFYHMFFDDDCSKECIRGKFKDSGVTELRILRPNNEIRWVKIHYQSLKNNEGSVGIIIDITNEKEILPELIKLREEIHNEYK